MGLPHNDNYETTVSGAFSIAGFLLLLALLIYPAWKRDKDCRAAGGVFVYQSRIYSGILGRGQCVKAVPVALPEAPQ